MLASRARMFTIACRAVISQVLNPEWQTFDINWDGPEVGEQFEGLRLFYKPLTLPDNLNRPSAPTKVRLSGAENLGSINSKLL